MGHVGMDVSHILCLKYMSSLARSLSDAVKLGLLWILGKTFWFCGVAIYRNGWPANGGTLTVLAESPERNSWMMIPALFLIGYAMLMFKFRTYCPLQYAKHENGRRQWVLVEAELTEEEKKNAFMICDTGIDDKFYVNVFHNRKIRKAVRCLQNKSVHDEIRSIKPEKRNKFQKAFVAMKQASKQSLPSVGISA